MLLRPAVDCARATNVIADEDEVFANERDARLAHFGLPPLDTLPSLPWIRALAGSNRHTTAVEARTWTTRRMRVSRVLVSVSVADLRASSDFVRDVRAALSHTRDWRKFRALRNVFATWSVTWFHMDVQVWLFTFCDIC